MFKPSESSKDLLLSRVSLLVGLNNNEESTIVVNFEESATSTLPLKFSKTANKVESEFVIDYSPKGNPFVFVEVVVSKYKSNVVRYIDIFTTTDMGYFNGEQISLSHNIGSTNSLCIQINSSKLQHIGKDYFFEYPNLNTQSAVIHITETFQGLFVDKTKLIKPVQKLNLTTSQNIAILSVNTNLTANIFAYIYFKDNVNSQLSINLKVSSKADNIKDIQVSKNSLCQDHVVEKTTTITAHFLEDTSEYVIHPTIINGSAKVTFDGTEINMGDSYLKEKKSTNSIKIENLNDSKEETRGLKSVVRLLTSNVINFTSSPSSLNNDNKLNFQNAFKISKDIKEFDLNFKITGPFNYSVTKIRGDNNDKLADDSKNYFYDGTGTKKHYLIRGQAVVGKITAERVEGKTTTETFKFENLFGDEIFLISCWNDLNEKTDNFIITKVDKLTNGAFPVSSETKRSILAFNLETLNGNEKFLNLFFTFEGKLGFNGMCPYVLINPSENLNEIKSLTEENLLNCYDNYGNSQYLTLTNFNGIKYDSNVKGYLIIDLNNTYGTAADKFSYAVKMGRYYNVKDNLNKITLEKGTDINISVLRLTQCTGCISYVSLYFDESKLPIELYYDNSSVKMNSEGQFLAKLYSISTTVTIVNLSESQEAKEKIISFYANVSRPKTDKTLDPQETTFIHEFKDNLSILKWKPLQQGEFSFVTKSYVIPFNKNELINEKTVFSMYSIYEKQSLLNELNALQQNTSELDSISLSTVNKGIYNLFVVSEYKDYGYAKFFTPQTKQAVNFVKTTVEMVGGEFYFFQYKNSPTMASEEFYFKFTSNKVDPIVGLQILPKFGGQIKTSTQSENPKLVSDKQLILFDLDQKDVEKLNVEFTLLIESTLDKYVEDDLSIVLFTKSNKYNLTSNNNKIHSLSLAHFNTENVLNFSLNETTRKLCDVQMKVFDTVTKITYKDKDTLIAITDFGAKKSTVFSFINEEGIKNAEFTVYTKKALDASVSFVYHCYEEKVRYYKLVNVEDQNNESGLKIHTLLSKDTFRFTYTLKDFIGDEQNPKNEIFNTQAMYIKPYLNRDLSKISSKISLIKSTDEITEDSFPKTNSAYPYDSKTGITIINKTVDNKDLVKVLVTVEITEEFDEWNFKILFSARPREINSFDFKEEVKDLVAYKNSINNICVSNLEGQYLKYNGANNLYVTKLGDYNVSLALNYGNVEFFSGSSQANIEPEAHIKFEGNQVNLYSINYADFMKNKVFCFSYRYDYYQTAFPTDKVNLRVNAVLSDKEYFSIPKDKLFAEFNLDLNMESSSHIRIPYSNYSELIGSEFLMYDNNLTDTLSYSLKQNKEYKDVADLFVEENPVKLNANFGVLTMDQTKNPNQDIVVHVNPKENGGKRTLSQFYYVPLNSKSSTTYKLNEVFAFKFTKSETKQKFSFSFDADENFGLLITVISGTGKVTLSRVEGDKTVEKVIAEKETYSEIRTRTEAKKEEFDLLCEQTDDKTTYVLVRTFSNNKETIPPKPEPTPDPPTLLDNEEEFLNLFIKLNDAEAITNFDNSMIRYLVSSQQCRVTGFSYHISNSPDFENVQDFPTEKQLRLSSIRSGRSKSFFAKFDRLGQVSQYADLKDKPIFLTMRLKMTKDKTGTDLLFNNKYLKEIPTFSFESPDAYKLDLKDLIGDFQFKMNTKEAKETNRYFVLNLQKQNNSNVTVTHKESKVTTTMESFDFIKVITLQSKITESSFAVFATDNNLAILSSESESETVVMPEYNINSSLSFDSNTSVFSWKDGIQNYDKLKNPNVEYKLFLIPGINTSKTLPLYEFLVGDFRENSVKTASKETTSVKVEGEQMVNGVYTAYLIQIEKTTRISQVYNLANRLSFDIERIHLETTGKVYSSLFGVTHKSEKDEKELVKLRLLVELDTSKLENLNSLQISFSETVEYNKFAFTYDTESSTADLNTNDNFSASIIDLSTLSKGLHDFLLTVEVERGVNTEIVVQLMLFDDKPVIKMEKNVLYENYYFKNYNVADAKDKTISFDFNDLLQESENCQVQLAYDNEKIEKVSYLYENEKKEKVEKILDKTVGKTLLAGFKTKRAEGDLPWPVEGKISVLKKQGESDLLLGVLAVLHCTNKGQNYFNYSENSGYIRVSNLAEETHFNFIYNIAPFDTIEKEIHRLQAFILTIVDESKVYATAFAEVIDAKEIKEDTFPRTKENSKFSLGKIHNNLNELEFYPDKEKPTFQTLAFTINIKPKPTNKALKEEDISRYNHSYNINFSNRIVPLKSLKDYQNDNVVLNSHAYTIFELSDFEEIVHNDLLALYLGTDDKNVVLYVSYQFHGFDVNFYDKNSSDESDFKLESSVSKFFQINIHEHKMYYSVDQQISRADGLYFYFHLENDFKKQKEEKIRFQARWTDDDLFLVNNVNSDVKDVKKSRNLDLNLFLLKDQSARILFDFNNISYDQNDEYFAYSSYESRVVKEGEGEKSKDVTHYNVNLSYNNNEAGEIVDKNSNLNKLFYPSEGFKSLNNNGIFKLSEVLTKSKTALLKVENNRFFNNEYSVYTGFSLSKLLSKSGEALTGIEFNRTYAVKLNKQNAEYRFLFEQENVKYQVRIEYPQGNIDKVGVQINDEPADEVLKNMPKKQYLVNSVEGEERVKLTLMAKEEEVDAYSIVLVTFVKESPEFIYVEKNKDLEKEEGDILYFSIKLKELNEDLSILQNSIYFQHETYGITSMSYTLEYNPSNYLTHKALPSSSEKLVRRYRDGSVAAGLANFSKLANDFKSETEVYLNVVIEKTPTDKAFVPFVLHHRKDKILRISDSENDYKSRTISQFNDDRFFLFMDNPNDKKYLMNIAINILGNSGKIYYRNCISNTETCRFKQVETDFVSIFDTHKINYQYIKIDRIPIRGVFEFRVLYNENNPNTVFVNLVRNAEFAEDYVTSKLPITVKQSEADNGQIKLDLSWEPSITTKNKETKPQPDVSYQLYYVKLLLGSEGQDREYFAYHMLEGKKFNENNNLCETPTTSCSALLPNGQYDLYLVAFEKNTGKYASYDLSKNLVLSQAMKSNDLINISLNKEDDYTIFYHFKISKNQEYWFNLSSLDQSTSSTTLKIFNRKSRTHYIFELNNGTNLQRGKFLTGEELNIEDEYVVEIHAFVKDSRETVDLSFFNAKFEKDEEKVAKVNLLANRKFSYSNLKDFQKIVLNFKSMSSFLLNLQQEDYVVKSVEVLNDKKEVVKTYSSEEISAKNTDLTFTPSALKLSELNTPIDFSIVINLDETKLAKETKDEKLVSLFVTDVSKHGSFEVVEFKNLLKRGLSKLFLGLKFRAKDTIRLIADFSDYKYRSDTELTTDNVVGFLKLSDELVNVRAKFVSVKPQELSSIKEADFPVLGGEVNKNEFSNHERGLSFTKSKDLNILLLTIEYVDKDAKTFNNYSIQLYDAPKYAKIDKSETVYSFDVNVDFNSPQVLFVPTDLTFMDIGDFLIYSHNEEYQLVFSYGEIPYSRDPSFSNIGNYENYVDFSLSKLTRVLIDDNRIFKKDELFLTVFANKSVNAVKGKIEFKLTNRRFIMTNTNSLIYSNITLLKGNTAYVYAQNTSRSDVKDTFVISLDKLSGNGVLKYKIVNKHESKYDSLDALFNFEGEGIVTVDSGFGEVEVENYKDVLIEITTPNSNLIGEVFLGKYLERFIANQNVFNVNVGSVGFFKMTDKNEGSLRILENSETEQMGLLLTQMGGKGTTEFTIGESKVTIDNDQESQKRLLSTGAKVCNISFSKKEGEDNFRIIRVFSSYGLKASDNLVKPNEKMTVKMTDLSKTANILVKFKQEYENNYIVLEAPAGLLFEKVNYDIFSEFQSFDQEKGLLFASPQKANEETSEFQGESYLSIKVPSTQMAGYVLLVVKLKGNKKPVSMRALLNRQIFKLREDEETYSFSVSHFEEKENAKLEPKTPVELTYQFTNTRTLQIKNSPDVSLLSLNLYLNEEKPFNCQFNFKDAEMSQHSFVVENVNSKNLFIEHKSKLEHFHVELRCLKAFENSLFAIVNFVDATYKNYEYSLKNTDYSLELYSTTEAQVDGVKVKQTKVTVSTKESFVPKLAASVQYYVAYSAENKESLSIFRFLKNDKKFTIAKVTENRFSLDGFDYEKNFHTKLFAHEVNSGRVVSYKDYTYNQLKYGSSWWVILLIILAVLIFIGIIVIVVHNVMKNRRMQSEELNKNLLSEDKDNNRSSLNDP
jgi:hypothetical protein